MNACTRVSHKHKGGREVNADFRKEHSAPSFSESLEKHAAPHKTLPLRIMGRLFLSTQVYKSKKSFTAFSGLRKFLASSDFSHFFPGSFNVPKMLVIFT